MRKVLGVMFAAGMCISLAQAQQFWQKKNPETWSEKECKKLLEDSPWAKTYQLTTLVLRPGSLTEGTGRGEDVARNVAYIVQVRSAKPIRQAVIQQGKIRSKYDQLAADKKQAADKAASVLLAMQFPDTIVIGVTYSSNSEMFDRELAAFWQKQNLPMVRHTIRLIAGGQSIEPLGFSVAPGAGREFALIFPRQVNGQPVVAPNGKFALEFEYPGVGTQTSTSNGRDPSLSPGRALVEFDVKKMAVAEGEPPF